MRQAATHGRLEQAIEAWRRENSGELRLSGAARSRILDAARLAATARPRLRPLGTLFSPLPRLAAAGALPVLLLSVVLGSLLLPHRGEDVSAGAAAVHRVASKATTLQVEKDGDEVVFVIANGTPVHRIYKSTNPRDFSGVPAYTTSDGSFRDRLESGSGLVYYRID